MSIATGELSVRPVPVQHEPVGGSHRSGTADRCELDQDASPGVQLLLLVGLRLHLDLHLPSLRHHHLGLVQLAAHVHQGGRVVGETQGVAPRAVLRVAK